MGEGGFIPWLRILVPTKDKSNKNRTLDKKKMKGRRIFSLSVPFKFFVGIHLCFGTTNSTFASRRNPCPWQISSRFWLHGFCRLVLVHYSCPWFPIFLFDVQLYSVVFVACEWEMD